MALRPLRPMTATAAPALPVGAEWTYEVKWDGYRALAVKDGRRVQLVSRNLKDLTSTYPAIAAAVHTLQHKTAMLDGEIVALDAKGRPSFQALQHRATSSLHLVFYAFDLVQLDGRDLTRRPLDERRARLAALELTPPIFLSDPLPGSPERIEAAVRRLGLEGVVAKRRDSRYEAGKRSDAWIKVKFCARQEFVVGGYKPNASNFDSLLVGYYEGRQLRFAGKVRAGFTPHARRELLERLTPLQAARCPFVNLPASRTGHWGEGVTADEMLTLRWVKPRIVVEVTFTEWTRDANLRHAAYVGLRDDKPARAVRREDA